MKADRLKAEPAVTLRPNQQSMCSILASLTSLLARSMACLPALLLGISATAQVITPIYSITNTGFTTPRNPRGGNLLLARDGSFYGTTEYGGTGGFGTVFNVTTGGVFTVLANFDSFSTGGDPYGGVTLGADGNLYGTTQSSGPHGYGTVFRLSTNGTLSVLYSFSATTWNGTNYTNYDGATPYAAVMLAPDGYLYGTTASGGANGSGTIFQMTTNGLLRTLFSFDRLVSSPPIGSTNVSGATPYAGLTFAPDGNLYGTTYVGGTMADGTAFRITPSGAFTVLTNFVGLNGVNPGATMTLGRDGSMYGTTVNGGIHASLGTVFKLTTNGVLTTILSFDTYTGAAPHAGVVFGPDGHLYGTTTGGGTNLTDTLGNVFRVTTNGVLTVLGDFWLTNGSVSEAGIAFGQDTCLYGTTYSGGSADPNAAGEVYRLNVGLTPASKPPRISIARDAGSAVMVTVTNAPGTTNRLWASTNLSLPIAQWQVLATNFSTNGLFQFRDTNTSAKPVRFYRASTP